MLETFKAAAAFPLVVVERSGFVESRHVGCAVVLSASGEVLCEVGDVFGVVYPRSTLKALQAVTVLRSGVPLFGARLAVAAASHRGTKRHMDLVDSVLLEAGFSVSDLLCPEAFPLDGSTFYDFVRRGLPKTKLAMTCSGKHAAFLWACKINGWPVVGYGEVGHPLQLAIRGVVEEYVGEPVVHVGVDGCGAAVFAVSLVGLARGIGRVAQAVENDPKDVHAVAVAQAVYSYPWVVEGEGCVDTVLMERLGIFVKSGVEGVLVLATKGGLSVAVKVLDGNSRAAVLVGLALLCKFGVIGREVFLGLSFELVERVLGGGEVVGCVRLADEFVSFLDGFSAA